jgi:hypothetical protein
LVLGSRRLKTALVISQGTKKNEHILRERVKFNWVYGHSTQEAELGGKRVGGQPGIQ